MFLPFCTRTRRGVRLGGSEPRGVVDHSGGNGAAHGVGGCGETRKVFGLGGESGRTAVGGPPSTFITMEPSGLCKWYCDSVWGLCWRIVALWGRRRARGGLNGSKRFGVSRPVGSSCGSAVRHLSDRRKAPAETESASLRSASVGGILFELAWPALYGRAGLAVCGLDVAGRDVPMSVYDSVRGASSELIRDEGSAGAWGGANARTLVRRVSHSHGPTLFIPKKRMELEPRESGVASCQKRSARGECRQSRSRGLKETRTPTGSRTR